MAVRKAQLNLTVAQDKSKQAQTQLSQTVGQAKVNWGTYQKQLNTMLNAQTNLSAYSKTHLIGALQTLTTVTGNAGESLKLLSLSTDLARGRNMDLGKAAQLVGRVYDGSTSVLKRYGIVLDAGATSTQALAAIQAKYSGQAKAYGDSSAGPLREVQELTAAAEDRRGQRPSADAQRAGERATRASACFRGCLVPGQALGLAGLGVAGLIAAPWFQARSAPSLREPPDWPSRPPAAFRTSPPA